MSAVCGPHLQEKRWTKSLQSARRRGFVFLLLQKGLHSSTDTTLFSCAFINHHHHNHPSPPNTHHRPPSQPALSTVAKQNKTWAQTNLNESVPEKKQGPPLLAGQPPHAAAAATATAYGGAVAVVLHVYRNVMWRCLDGTETGGDGGVPAAKGRGCGRRPSVNRHRTGEESEVEWGEGGGGGGGAGGEGGGGGGSGVAGRIRVGDVF
ncbi:hypothetical protein HanHA300_Chr16g0633761 [Helianthus annuus]|nr:hypothetical protein HanHA300_Chr16g0633761 [Helianthus annuus]